MSSTIAYTFWEHYYWPVSGLTSPHHLYICCSSQLPLVFWPQFLCTYRQLRHFLTLLHNHSLYQMKTKLSQLCCLSTALPDTFHPFSISLLLFLFSMPISCHSWWSQDSLYDSQLLFLMLESSFGIGHKQVSQKCKNHQNVRKEISISSLHRFLNRFQWVVHQQLYQYKC